MKYKMVKIVDVCIKVISGGTPLTSQSSFYYPKEIPWLKTAEVNYCRIYDTENYISKEGLERSGAKLIPENSVIVAMYGQGDTAGRVAINKIPLSTNQACCNLIIDHRIANYEYVYYALSNMYDKLVSLKNGGAQPNLNVTIVKSIEIPFPKLEIQNKIASIFSTYDNLIENNQKQIKLLEEAAQRLYTEWFVKLRFPGYEDAEIEDGIPEGWEKLSVEDIIEYEIGGGWGEENITEKYEYPAYVIRGTDFYGITHGKIKSVPYRVHKKSNLVARTLIDGDIIFEVSGGSRTEGVAKTVLIRQCLLDHYNAPVMCASFCKLVRAKSIEYSQILFDTFQYLRRSGKTMEFDKKSASSIVNYRWKDFLMQQEILIPSKEILDSYNSISENIYFLKLNCSMLIEKAEQARNYILPRLMNGEIGV